MAESKDERKATSDKTLVEADANDVRRVLGDFLNRAGFGNEHIVIVRHGKQTAALVSMPDLERIRGKQVQRAKSVA